MQSERPRIVILGGGFGGLTFCQTFRHPSADLVLVDRQNHHLFQPLLYQVATAGLSAPEIAQPIRSILRDHPNVQVRLGDVELIEPDRKCVTVNGEAIAYDWLVFALGGRTGYFGHPEWAAWAPGLKTLADAQRIRRDLLLAFERAENTESPEERRRLLTAVVVGGGPTGVELAGAIAELAHHVLVRDFRRIDPRTARIVLVEAGPRLLPQFSEDLGRNAEDRLRAMGVEVRCALPVQEIQQRRVLFRSGESVEAGNILWGAGVEASPLTTQLGAPLDRAGRVRVNPDLSVPGHPEIFVIGDAASVADASGRPVPGVSPAAIQGAGHVARQIEDALDGHPHRHPFRYWDKGSMATIGRSAAVAEIGPLRFSGYPAWLAWLFVHLVFLIGFRNRAAVLGQWIYSYCTYRRGARIVVRDPK
ncbi:MAG: NAD(P)/FAD-dependent oxidoreductase, partial [Verrucomicrobia bacterium]|nr:NAD(P)/FAD-dependent oxidoreductase [Verrucomicrobiota bacterium]